MNNIWYWKIRGVTSKLIFRVKKSIFYYDKWNRQRKDFQSLRTMLFINIIKKVICTLVLAIILQKIDTILLASWELPIIRFDDFKDIIIAEVGVTGVILGLYASNIVGIYSTRYINVPEKIAKRFHYDQLTSWFMNMIIKFILFGTIVLFELMLDIKVGWGTAISLIIWSFGVVIAYGIVGNRTYQLSDIFKVTDDIYRSLVHIIRDYLNQDNFVTDINFQKHFYDNTLELLQVLRLVQKYGCNINEMNNLSILDFMSKNLGIIEQYWKIKPTLSRESLWFEQKHKYQRWHYAEGYEVSIALKTGTSLNFRKEPDYYWFENEIFSINQSCIDYLIEKKDFESLYKYYEGFSKLCETAIYNKEAEYFIQLINRMNKKIQELSELEIVNGNISFIGIVDQLSIIILSLIMEASNYLSAMDINSFCESIINSIDLGKPNTKEIRGKENEEIYKKILLEIRTEGKRVTPDWLVKQYFLKEEYVYMNSLSDIVSEGIERAFVLGNFFLGKSKNYEACILFSRFYEYESKLLDFFENAKSKDKDIKAYYVNKEDQWDSSRIDSPIKKVEKYKNELPDKLLKCASEFSFKNWEDLEKYPDFLGGLYNNLSEHAVQAIVKNDKEQFEKNFENLTRLMLLYQEYIRSDLGTEPNLFRLEYVYYMITSPIAEWAQIGGLGILFGEFCVDSGWKKIIDTAVQSLLDKVEKNRPNIKEDLVSYVNNRNKFLYGIGPRNILENDWNLRVSKAIGNLKNIRFESVRYDEVIKTDSKIIKAFCPFSRDIEFISHPEEVFWVTCINPSLSEEKRYKTKFNWEAKLDEKYEQDFERN